MAETKEKRYVSDNAQLMVEWDREANDKMMFYPHNVTLGNNALKVHWTCAYGHKWQATVHSRFKLKTNCPYCSGRYATIETSLATMNPALSSQWDYSKNERLTPLNVKPFSLIHFPISNINK